MAKSLLDTARKYLKKREFSKVIELLLPHVFEYRDSFQFYYILGIACLYQGDIGGCEDYFKSARHIKMNDVNLLLGQAVLFLKKGRIEKAIEYCVDAINLGEIFDKEIDTIYLNFSDPWPKKRHAKRRLTSHVFLPVYDKIFKDTKTIIQKTDNVGLYESSLVSLSK